MVVALGEAYDRLDRLQEAKKCFWKAHSLGDVEGLALVKLAKWLLSHNTITSSSATAAVTPVIINITSLGAFKRALETELFRRSYGNANNRPQQHWH